MVMFVLAAGMHLFNMAASAHVRKAAAFPSKLLNDVAFCLVENARIEQREPATSLHPISAVSANRFWLIEKEDGSKERPYAHCN